MTTQIPWEEVVGYSDSAEDSEDEPFYFGEKDPKQIPESVPKPLDTAVDVMFPRFPATSSHYDLNSPLLTTVRGNYFLLSCSKRILCLLPQLHRLPQSQRKLLLGQAITSEFSKQQPHPYKEMTMEHPGSSSRHSLQLHQGTNQINHGGCCFYFLF